MLVGGLLHFILSSSILLRYVSPTLVRNPSHGAVLTLALQAFIAVLKVRFGDPIGLRKIEKGQFALEDTRLKHGLSLAKPWTALVRPGQHISMSMVFRRQQTCTGSCPSCGERNDESKDLEVDW